jgi:hypothetical protein
MLIVGQDPDNKAVRESKQLSRDNDDRSADRLWATLDELDFHQDVTFQWNAVPWTNKKGTKDLDLVREWGSSPTSLSPWRT